MRLLFLFAVTALAAFAAGAGGFEFAVPPLAISDEAHKAAVIGVFQLNNMAWKLATISDTNADDEILAIQIAERACDFSQYQETIMIGTLAAAYASAGRFNDAVSMGQKACALATEHGQQELLKRNRELVALYQSHQAYREPVQIISLGSNSTVALPEADRINPSDNRGSVLFDIGGDSLSATITPSGHVNDGYVVGTNTWPTLLASDGFTNVVNWALGGSVANFQLQIYTNNDSPLAPRRLPHVAGQRRYFIFMCGANDMLGYPSNSLSKIETNLLLTWQAARADGYKVIASTVTGSFEPNDNWYSPDNPKHVPLLELNAWIAGHPEQWDGLVDAYHVVTPNNIVNGVHWCHAGNRQFESAVEWVLMGPPKSKAGVPD